MITLAHLVNVFHAPASSDLHTAQPITLETMRRARAAAGENISVELWAAAYPEDRDRIPEDFKATPPLQHSVLDHHPFLQPVRLPLIRELLQGLYDNTTAEYLIYTNVDIALYPEFYRRVAQFIHDGHDAFIINRRRIPGHYTRIEELDTMLQEPGKNHPGFDCFVFHRSLYPQLVLENLCIGVPFFEISFSQNLFCLAQHFRLYDNEKLTFHIGMEIFKRRMPKEYIRYNRQQYYAIIRQLEPLLDSRKFPYADRWWLYRWITWGLHPCIPIRLAMRLDLGMKIRSEG